jgi:hypothetical protein
MMRILDQIRAGFACRSALKQLWCNVHLYFVAEADSVASFRLAAVPF